MRFYEIIYDSGHLNEQTIGDYEGILEGFDYYTFLEGKRFKGKIPNSVRLYLNKGDENLPRSSLLANPLGWKIFSQSLLDYWWPLIKDDIQVFDAPVYTRNGEKVEGYKIINPIRIIDYLDIEKSQIAWDKDGTISFVGKPYIKEDKAGNHHIFRLKGYLYPVIVSGKLAKSLAGTDFKGIAFIRCGVSPSKSLNSV